MKFLNHAPVLLMCIALSVSPAYAAGMEGMQEMPGIMKDTTKATNDQVHKGKGTIENIDRNKRAITLNHQPIKSMGWSAMTMTFSVKDDASIGKLTPGQTVDFEFVRAPDGQYSITRIATAAAAKPDKQRSENSHEQMMGGMMAKMGPMMDTCTRMMEDTGSAPSGGK
jgi:Cu/Ag efflux protein CusF